MNSALMPPVDVVISWVDGNDPEHARKIQQYVDPVSRKSDDIAGPTRYGSVGEIFYCVASILRNAPFVRKIFIIADNQNPQLDDFIAINFPGSSTQIELIDHKIIFRDYEYLLPVFNSRAIETCTFRIPDLSENYIYFNDDFFLMRPVMYEDWFRDNKIIAYGHWRSIFLDTLLWLIKPLKNGHKPVGFKDGMMRAAKVLKQKRKYFHLEHMPHPLKKSIIADFFEQNPNVFLSNASFKFRSASQFNTQALYYLLMFRKGLASIEPTNDVFLYLKPVNRGHKYLARKLKLFEQNPNIKFACIGSLDMATEDDRNTLKAWLSKTLNIVFPE